MKRRIAKKTIIALAVSLVLTVLIILTVTDFWTRNSFKKSASETLTHAAQLKTLEFTSSLNGQLALVRQMIKAPSIIAFFENPEDPDLQKVAFAEFASYKEGFLSKSIFWAADANKEFWQDMKYGYTLDPEDPSTYWYKMTMYETDEYNFNINYNPDLNVTMLWVNAVVRNESGNPVGITGTGIPLTDFIESMYSGLDERIVMYLYDDDLKITGAKDQSILGENHLVTEKMPALEFTDAVPAEMTLYTNSSDMYMLAPMELVKWHMVMKIEFSMKAFWQYAHTPIASCLVVLLILLAITIVVNIIASITTLKKAVENLSSGNADLTQRVNLKNPSLFNVVNELTDALNKFMEKLHRIIMSVKNSNTNLVETGDNLENCTQDTSASITQIIANIQSMDHNILVQAESVDGTSTAVTQISSNISSLNKMIDNQNESVAQASTAIEEMIGNIGSVNNSVGKLSSSFKELHEKANDGVVKQSDVNDKILKIREQSQMLEDANKAISDIAEQTNLLAMNAAIEAAHAGEAGKGFSVVADEIRKLSENSSEQSKTIGAQLQSIQDSVNQIVVSSQESRDVLKAVADSIDKTDMLVQEITGAMDEQQAGSDQISEALHLLNDTSSEVKVAAEEMQNGNEVILREVEKLEDATSSMKIGMEEMMTGAKKINETGEALFTLSHDVEDSIKKIDDQLGQFRV